MEEDDLLGVASTVTVDFQSGEMSEYSIIPIFVSKRPPIQLIPVESPLWHEPIHVGHEPLVVETLVQVTLFVSA